MHDPRYRERIRLLIVEADPQLAQTAQTIQRMLYFEQDIMVVGVATTAQETVAHALTLRPHVILMDLNLLDRQEHRALDRILRQVPSRLVIMSGQAEADPENLRRAMRAGACAYLIKPFTTDELTFTLRQVAAVFPGCMLGHRGYPSPADEERARAAQERERKAQEQAERLLRDVIGEEAYQRLQGEGYLDVPSPHYPRRVYRIPRAGGPATVLTRSRSGDRAAKRRLCLVPAESGLPAADRILIHKLLIEGDEERYLHTAHRV